MSSLSLLAAKKKTVTPRWTVVICALLLVPALLTAQSFRGSIRGTVRDANGGLLPGAKVRAKSADTGLVREVTTGSEGGYVLAELPAGRYTVTAEAASLSPVAQNLQVNVGVDTTADFDLTQVEQRKEALTVVGEAPIVEASRDVFGEVVDQKSSESELPLNGRDFGKLVALVPGATVEPSGVAASRAASDSLHQRESRSLQQLHVRRHGQQRSLFQ